MLRTWVLVRTEHATPLLGSEQLETGALRFQVRRAVARLEDVLSNFNHDSQ